MSLGMAVIQERVRGAATRRDRRMAREELRRESLLVPFYREYDNEAYFERQEFLWWYAVGFDEEAEWDKWKGRPMNGRPALSTVGG